jgi:hypothetical protein
MRSSEASAGLMAASSSDLSGFARARTRTPISTAKRCWARCRAGAKRAIVPSACPLREFMDTVRDPLVSGDQSGYGQVARLRSGISPPDLNVLWVAANGAITAPFEPFWIGTQQVPPEYGKHRYLSSGEADRLLTRDFQIQEATEFAYLTFERLMYYTCDKPEKFLPEVTEALTAFENQNIAESRSIEARAGKLFAAHEPEMARAILTD